MPHNGYRMLELFEVTEETRLNVTIKRQNVWLTSFEWFWLNSCWLFQAHSNGACLIQPLDSATDTTVGKSEQLSIDLKECITDLTKPGTSPGAISKQWQVLNQQYVSISARPSCVTAHDQEENTNYHLLSQQKNTRKQVRSCWKSSQVCYTSAWAERLLRKKEALVPDAAP